MKLEEIQNEWEKDSHIERDDLTSESLKSNELHNKYFKIYNQEKLNYHYIQSEKNRIYKKRWCYYNGVPIPENNNEVYEVKITLKQDLQKFIESDDDLINTDMKLKYIEQKIEYLESIIKQISQRTFIIKNAIEWEKFTSGL